MVNDVVVVRIVELVPVPITSLVTSRYPHMIPALTRVESGRAGTCDTRRGDRWISGGRRHTRCGHIRNDRGGARCRVAGHVSIDDRIEDVEWPEVRIENRLRLGPTELSSSHHTTTIEGCIHVCITCQSTRTDTLTCRRECSSSHPMHTIIRSTWKTEQHLQVSMCTG